MKSAGGCMAATNVKNQQEKTRLKKQLDILRKEEKLVNETNTKNVNAVRQELMEMTAYKKVYKEYSLYRIDSKKQKKTNRVTPILKSATKSGSSRMNSGMITLTPGLYKFKDGEDADDEEDVESWVLAPTPSCPLQSKNLLAFYRCATTIPDVRVRTTNGRKSTGDIENELKKEKAREDTSSSCIMKKVTIDARKPRIDYYGYEAPEVTKQKRPRKKKYIPPELDGSSYLSFRRFLNREASRILEAWTPESRRKKKVQKLLDDETHFPKLIHRSKTTSAIFRDYNRHQEWNLPVVR